ncbi:hypothetical protein HGA64_00470, partial [Candidatus Falkowbacteria bacterium]|nr:hypothetical protein [Candidatus Falkowbacteria bacterium]
KIVGKIEFKGQPHEMFLSGNRLVVFGSDAGNQLADPASVCNSGKAGCLVPKESPIWGNEFTFAKVYDISDKTKPKLERETATEGSYVDSRLIDGYVYLVTSKATYDTYITDPLPVMLRQGKLVENSIMPPVYYFDMPYESFNFVSVASFKVDDPAQQEKSEVYMMSNAQNIFVSPDNIYITYSKYLNEGKLRMEAMKELLLSKLTETDKQRVAKIEAADEQVLSQNEKLAKEVQIMSRYLMAMLPADQEKFEQEVKNVIKNKFADISQELEKTVIHKIAIKQGNLEYKTAGEVTGSVLNQFAMDESDGYFRIATTKNRTWSSLIDESEKESYSSLFILDKDLKQVGSVTDLAKGERIYSVRFIGKRAYLVTFKQTDPLFVIDLSAPTAPKVLGQLKIPGFSNYLHPYDENTLIGFGKETSISSWGGTITGGLKLSLFDVSQVDKPVELDHYVMGDRGSDSVALNNHKAFLFSKDKNILVLPVSLYQAASKDEWGKFVFGGAMVFSIDNKKFTLKGRIDHSNGGQSGENYYFDGYSYYDNNVLRSLYIKDTLYTLSGRYIKANKLSDLSQISSLDLVELNKREPLGVASSSPSGPIIPLNQPTGTFNSATPNSQGVAAPTPAMPVKDLKKLK